MQLFEHRDFEQEILRAEEHFRARGLRTAVIEKDYYVTEALQRIAGPFGDQIIFKCEKPPYGIYTGGGTVLNRRWGWAEDN